MSMDDALLYNASSLVIQVAPMLIQSDEHATQRRQKLFRSLCWIRMAQRDLRLLFASAVPDRLGLSRHVAQLKKPFLARMVVVYDNPLGETAYATDSSNILAARGFPSVSHSAALEASPSNLVPKARGAALGPDAPWSGSPSR